LREKNNGGHLEKDGIIGFIWRFHFDGLLVLLGGEPDGAAEGPDLLNTFVGEQVPHLLVVGRGEVFHDGDSLVAHLWRGRVVPLVAEDGHSDVGGAELDDDGWRRFVGALGKSPSTKNLGDGVAHLWECGQITVGPGGSEDGFEEGVIDLSREAGLIVGSRDVEDSEGVHSEELLPVVEGLFEVLHLGGEGGDGGVLGCNFGLQRGNSGNQGGNFGGGLT